MKLSPTAMALATHSKASIPSDRFDAEELGTLRRNVYKKCLDLTDHSVDLPSSSANIRDIWWRTVWDGWLLKSSSPKGVGFPWFSDYSILLNPACLQLIDPKKRFHYIRNGTNPAIACGSNPLVTRWRHHRGSLNLHHQARTISSNLLQGWTT